jgi:hypothetical protein
VKGRKSRKAAVRRARSLIADDRRGVARRRANELRRADRRPPPVQEAIARLSRSGDGRTVRGRPDAPRSPGGKPATGQEHPNGNGLAIEGNGDDARPVALAFARHRVSVTVDIETGERIEAGEARYLARVGADAAREAVAEALDRAGVAAAVSAVWCCARARSDRLEGASEGSGTRRSEADHHCGVSIESIVVAMEDEGISAELRSVLLDVLNTQVDRCEAAQRRRQEES